MPLTEDYEVLVAAHFLRSTRFAARNAVLVKASIDTFFGSLFLRDVMRRGMDYFLETGRLLPKAALKSDMVLYGQPGVSHENYEAAIDRVFAEPLDAEEHVQDSIVREAQDRAAKMICSSFASGTGTVAELKRSMDEVWGWAGLGNVGVQKLSEGLVEALSSPPIGIPTGIPGLDVCLNGGGVCPGETLLLFGRYSIGKSMILHHMARTAAIVHRRPSVVLTLETSRFNTMMRLAGGALGLTKDALRADPGRAMRRLVDEFDDPPLFVEYRTPGSATPEEIRSIIDRVEQQIGRKVEALFVDYSEKRASTPEWGPVRKSYEEIRAICGERKMAGYDVAQENAIGKISHFGLLKDADIGIHLTVSTNSSLLYMLIHRNREGPSGVSVPVHLDRDTGKVTPHTASAEASEDAERV